MIRQYLSDIINNHKPQNESKIQLSLAINFVSSKVFKETCIMYANSDNIDIMIQMKQMKSLKNSLNFF